MARSDACVAILIGSGISRYLSMNGRSVCVKYLLRHTILAMRKLARRSLGGADGNRSACHQVARRFMERRGRGD